jgi:uncharacterized membrane protein
MKTRRLTVCLVICCMFLAVFVSLSFKPASCQDYAKYSLKISGDGSAVWTITKFSDVNDAVDTWQVFQDRIFNLLDATVTVTGRSMDIDGNSPQINTTISAESKITEYSFLWQNFSVVHGSDVTFGDVFQVTSFFNQLYGDGALQVTYPSTFAVKSVTPEPYQQDASAKTFTWARTQDLTNTKATVTLTSSLPASTNEDWLPYVAVGVASAVVTFSLASFYMIKRRRSGEKATALLQSPLVESEEDKVIKILKASGGSMRQSDITERCGFSKAKTSQLLSALENRGILTRYKKGRDKIVTLKGKSEK